MDTSIAENTLDIDEQANNFVARVKNELITTLPEDLYIPPDALEVILETFEGPLDLLLYLIRKHNLDILDIQIAEITKQYMQYIAIMKHFRLELAAEYLLMAAMLAEIKSRMLLPKPELEAEQEEDPRAELIRRLQEYERFKKAAEDIESLPQVGKDIFTGYVATDNIKNQPAQKSAPEVDMGQLVTAFLDILKRSELLATHTVKSEPLSVRERMSSILENLQTSNFMQFQACFTLEEGRTGVIVSFLAILELLKLGMINIVQAENYGPIHITKVESDNMDENNQPFDQETDLGYD